ncbi:MAG: riboflavin synthase [Bacteroidetes bacterium]|nr:riboflavin synthase [Bacteroidota bacterium]MBI3483502.1 riboflavin synthase [Bacteroidota bacterium]
MFTGIIETVGEVVAIKNEGTNKHFKIASLISNELKVDQSVSHDGVCLTVVWVGDGFHWVVAIQETLQKSNLDSLSEGDKINIERCMIANGRFDGHIVQGHVDQVGKVKTMEDQNGSWLFTFAYDSSAGNVTVEKGSISVNGVSLTCFNSKDGEFSVAIIPYTFENTGFRNLKVGDNVNLEFDIIGKYVKRLLNK